MFCGKYYEFHFGQKSNKNSKITKISVNFSQLNHLYVHANQGLFYLSFHPLKQLFFKEMDTGIILMGKKNWETGWNEYLSFYIF